MTGRDPNVSRWKHFRATLSRQTRGRGKDTLAFAVLALAAITMTLWIFTQQKASLPSWAPLVGEDFAALSADFGNAQAVTPGQGQAVILAGIQIGRVSSVDLVDGQAVVGMEVEPEYLDIIHPNATLLLRPKTNLNDMTVEIDPGDGRETVEEGHSFPLSQTEPAIQFEEFIATLDADTRQYIQLLVAGGAEGIGGRGRQLSGAFRRFQPFARNIAQLNRAVAERRRELARVIHYFGLLTTELGRHDNQVERFVTSSKDALGDFANVQASLQETIAEFPPTLTALRSALDSSERFTTVARPALVKLIPQARALGPAFAANKRLFNQTTVPIRDQIRPFTRQIRPVLTHLEQGSDDFRTTVRGFGNTLGAFNSFLNRLAFKPKGSRESYLFYVPWANQNLNANFNLVDAGGPLLRGVPVITCNASFLAFNLTQGRKPFLSTFLQGARIPSPGELPEIPEDKRNPGVRCGPQEPNE